jgi:lipopolysaccharide heptosyltransferase I
MMTRLLVVRLGSIGDLIHTLPAVAAIHRTHPDLEIDWLVDAVHRDLLTLVPILSGIVALRGRTVGAWLEARRTLRARRYDAALDFQGLIKSAALARLSGARRVIGFDRASLREPWAAAFYTERVAVGEGRHVVDKNLRLAAVIGATAGEAEFPLDVAPGSPIDPGQADAAAVEAHRPTGPFALVNPGAAWPNKRWPPERFGQIARILRDRHGLTSIVLWGPGELPLAEAVIAAGGDAAVVAPETSLPGLVALARGARLIVSGDTGPLHIAAALGVPAVALFGPTNPARNGPWRAADISLSRYRECICHYERRCRRDARDWCLGSITVEEVGEAIGKRLAEAQGPGPKARGSGTPT